LIKGHTRHVVPIYRFNYYEMHCEEKLKFRSHNTMYWLIELVAVNLYVVQAQNVVQ